MLHRLDSRADLRTDRLVFAVLAAFMCAIAAATPAYAQEEPKGEPAGNAQPVQYSDKGFYLGIRFIGSSLHVDESDADLFFVKDDGGGAQLQAGFRFNRVFALELSFGGSNHDTSDQRISADLGYVQLFAIYRFVPGNPFRPYIKGGLGGYGLKLDGGDVDATASGGGIALGGGFDYFFSPHFSLGVDFTHNMIHYEDLEIRLGGSSVGTQIDEEGAMSSLGLSFAYYF